MNIKRFNEGNKEHDTYWKKYRINDNYWYENILNDISILNNSILNNSRVEYQIFYRNHTDFVIYAVGENSEFLKYHNFNFSLYNSINDCIDDLKEHDYITITIEDIPLISNTHKFNL